MGKARLNAAVKAFESRSSPDDTAGAPKVHVSFRPYMIDVRTQPNGEDYLAYNERRWGGDGWTASMKRCVSLVEFFLSRRVYVCHFIFITRSLDGPCNLAFFVPVLLAGFVVGGWVELALRMSYGSSNELESFALRTSADPRENKEQG